MSDKSKKSGFMERMKNTKANRASIITGVVLVAAIAVVISVTVASNRKKDKTPPPDVSDIPNVSDTDTPSVLPPNDTDAPETDAPTPNKPNNNGGSSQVEDKLPSFILPVSGVLSRKHDPELQVYSPTLNDYRVHLGIDIVTDEDAPVYAAADGTVSKIWKDDMMGYCVAIKHSGDCYTIYQNLSDTLPDGIKEGVAVRSGQLIASVGDSAMIEVADEPHLHFEMTVADLSVDPLEYFNEKALESLTIDASFEGKE